MASRQLQVRRLTQYNPIGPDTFLLDENAHGEAFARFLLHHSHDIEGAA